MHCDASLSRRSVQIARKLASLSGWSIGLMAALAAAPAIPRGVRCKAGSSGTEASGSSVPVGIKSGFGSSNPGSRSSIFR